MKRVATVLLVGVVTALAGTMSPGAAAQAGQAPARDAVPRSAGTGTISGRVLAADAGAPVRRTIIRLVSSELGEARSAMTDADGKYEFTELPAGSYMVVAQ